MKSSTKIKSFELHFAETLNLISLYKKEGISIAASLKGNLGEFLIAKEIALRYPTASIKFRGGTFPGFDITIDSVRIQIKTQIKHERQKYKNGSYDYESSPTIKKKIIDYDMCDIIVLVILMPSDDFDKILKSHFYVFVKSDFAMFRNVGCWSGKSKGDYSIMNILDAVGTPTKRVQRELDHYQTDKYRELFKSSLNNWSKIDALLKK